jgi:hypothetical protein
METAYISKRREKTRSVPETAFFADVNADAMVRLLGGNTGDCIFNY